MEADRVEAATLAGRGESKYERIQLCSHVLIAKHLFLFC
jgi:hypothetical protein